MGNVVPFRPPGRAALTAHEASGDSFAEDSPTSGGVALRGLGAETTVRRGSTVTVWPDPENPGRWAVHDYSDSGGGQTYERGTGGRTLKGLSFPRACILASKIAKRSGAVFVIDDEAKRARADELAGRRPGVKDK